MGIQLGENQKKGRAKIKALMTIIDCWESFARYLCVPSLRTTFLRFLQSSKKTS